MESLKHFLDKFWNSLLDIHPLTYLVFFIVSLFTYLLINLILRKYSPEKKRLNLKSGILSIFVGLPIVGLLFYLIIFLILYNHSF